MRNHIIAHKQVQKKIMDTCFKCNFLSCVCDIINTHDVDCKFRKSATCTVAIECKHGYDVCPTCDPCTCKKL